MRSSFVLGLTVAGVVRAPIRYCYATSIPFCRNLSQSNNRQLRTMAAKSRQPIRLILDWDGTLTEKDTLALVAKVGYDKQAVDPDTGSNPEERQAKGQFILPWSEYGRLYMLDYSAHKDEYRPTSANRTTLEAERKWLKSLENVEGDSVSRVQASGIFKGVTTENIANGASSAIRSGQLKLRNGWEELLRNIIEDGSKSPQSSFRIPNMQRNKISILSVNWSETFIRKALEATQPLSPDQGRVTAEGQAGRLSVGDFRLVEFFQSRLVIHANDVQGHDLDAGSNGMVWNEVGFIRTSRDKVTRLPERCYDNLDSGTHGALPPNAARVVYVGDSDTDLECLLAADLGICIRDEPMGSTQAALAETLERLQISTKAISDLAIDAEEHVIYWAKDFEEIRLAFQNAALLSKSI